MFDASSTAAVNCTGVVMNGASCLDSPTKSGAKLLSASEGKRGVGLVHGSVCAMVTGGGRDSCAIVSLFYFPEVGFKACQRTGGRSFCVPLAACEIEKTFVFNDMYACPDCLGIFYWTIALSGKSLS